MSTEKCSMLFALHMVCNVSACDWHNGTQRPICLIDDSAALNVMHCAAERLAHYERNLLVVGIDHKHTSEVDEANALYPLIDV